MEKFQKLSRKYYKNFGNFFQRFPFTAMTPPSLAHETSLMFIFISPRILTTTNHPLADVDNTNHLFLAQKNSEKYLSFFKKIYVYLRNLRDS